MALYYDTRKDKTLVFYNDKAGPIPDDAKALDETLYHHLLQAHLNGATLAEHDGEPAAMDWQGQVIDLATLKKGDHFSPPPALKDLASSALSDVQSQAPMIVAMGETFGPKTKAYVQALQAIINGSDTTRTDLPQAPKNVTD